MKIILGPGTRMYVCRACGQYFAWHPGHSGLTWPECCQHCHSPYSIDEVPYHEEGP